MDGTLTPLQRIFLAFVAFFAVLFNRRFAEEVAQVRARTRASLPPPPFAPPPSPATEPSSTATSTATSTPTPTSSVRAERRPAEPAVVEARTAAKPAAKATVEGTLSPSRAHADALHVLALLQRDGRLVDFLSENLTGFSDAEIGAAARTVHAGCRKTLDAYVELEPVFHDAEGATVTVSPGFDAAAVRLTGNVVGAPPFKGALRHHGWRVKKASFPSPPGDPRILAPAEVELG